MEITDLIASLTEICFNLFQYSQKVLEWVTTSYAIGSFNFTVLELIFGIGIPVLLGAILTKWIIDFIP